MTFTEAATMAEQIAAHYPRLDVLAVGRFVPLPELDTTPERWGVSVRVDRGERSRVIWSRDELLAFATQTKPTRSTQRRRVPVEDAGAPMLF